jgi:hypothetical protein
MDASVQPLVIVRRWKTERFGALARAFAGEPEVTIVWDRRQSDRRRDPGAGEMDRRAGRDRRRAPPSTWTSMDFLVTRSDGFR